MWGSTIGPRPVAWADYFAPNPSPHRACIHLMDALYNDVIARSNDLTNLLPIGTLTFYNVPTDRWSLYGTDAPDSWRWLDLSQLHETQSTHEVVGQLRFLIDYRFAMATYRTLAPGVPIVFVRLYALPSDTNTASIMNEWRRRFPKSRLLDKRRKEAWAALLPWVDFSASGWDGALCLLLPYRGSLGPIPQSPNFIERWRHNLPYAPPSTVLSPNLAQRLRAVYNGVPLPDVSLYLSIKNTAPLPRHVPSATQTLVKVVELAQQDEVSIPGVKSKLYPFQVNSLCKMFEKESSVQRGLIPSLTELKSPTGETFYFDIQHCKFNMQPELYVLPRGGILAENMGLGKTLICLSLICLTKHELSRVPEDMLLYNDVSDDIITVFADTPRRRLHSLSNICRDTINQNGLPWKYYTADLPSTVVAKLQAKPGYFRIPLTHDEYASPYRPITRAPSARWRSLSPSSPGEGHVYRTLYLCNTTLIIVPDNIFHQWKVELHKHIEHLELNKLYITSHHKNVIEGEAIRDTVPEPLELITYDLVIMSTSHLIRHVGEVKPADNPLLRVFWKRLIIDEGHSMSSKASRASDLCRAIRSERRWAVTGTPTSGLTRLQMDEDSASGSNKYTVRSKFNEKDDLAKLGVILGNFLQIEPFHLQSKLWSSVVVKPFLANASGLQLGLTNIVNAVMVRHSPADIDKQLHLPPLHHRAVFLDPSYHNTISINLFTAVLAVNAISSERTDIDYMFHPANRQQLRRLITNLQRATFHWTGFQQEDIDSLVGVCRHALEKANNDPTKYSALDVSLLHRSLEVSLMALENPRWRSAALLHEMNYYIKGLPDQYTRSFGTGLLGEISVYGAPHIHAIQEFFYKNRFVTDSETIQAKLDEISRPFWSNYWKSTVKKNTEKFNKHDQTPLRPEQVSEALKTPASARRMPDDSVKNQLTRDDGRGLRETEFVAANQDMTYQTVRQAQILGTASSKLSYLGARILEHQEAGVKSIVFFEFEDSAFYLTEMLDLLGLNYILYATFIKPVERAGNLARFANFDSGGITLVMDLRLAAHGLTIIAATWVYFISPVWKRSVEAQAIKRAHRIGQTKEVHVETLVLKGTLEEEIYRKRLNEAVSDDSDDGESNQKRYVIDDTGMQEFILKHRFLRHNTIEEFASFCAPSVLSQHFVGEDDDYSLLRHKDTLEGSDRSWNVKVFTSDNLAKINDVKAKRSLMEEERTTPLPQVEPRVSKHKRVRLAL